MVGATIQRQENGQTVNISANYAYNHNGMRVRANSTVNGIASNRIFLLDEMNHTGYAQVLEELGQIGGSPVKSYTIGDDILSQSSGLGVRHFLYDGHGSTRMLADTAGAITSRYDYDAYGKMIGGDPNLANPAETDMLYSGEQFDADLQMQYLRARFYDQNTGRFASLDSFSGNNSNPQNLHKYGYCHADPVNGIDPSGRALYAFDGTANYPGQIDEGVNSPTNIHLMQSAYNNPLKWYEPGVGNEEEYGWYNPMRYLGQTLGAGADDKINTMYKKLIKYYNAGDHEIDIIGFSRGGVMAVKFAELIMKYGIPKTDEAEITSLYDGRNTGEETYSPDIRFLGLFDPVPGPVGMSCPSAIPGNVQKTAIAYSLDEKRTAFQPMIVPSGNNVIMRGFPGGHSDVGGGYCKAGLSNEAMRWMVGQGGSPFSMPSTGRYNMTLEKFKHQESQWFWSFGDRVLPVGLDY